MCVQDSPPEEEREFIDVAKQIAPSRTGFIKKKKVTAVFSGPCADTPGP